MIIWMPASESACCWKLVASPIGKDVSSGAWTSSMPSSMATGGRRSLNAAMGGIAWRRRVRSEKPSPDGRRGRRGRRRRLAGRDRRASGGHEHGRHGEDRGVARCGSSVRDRLFVRGRAFRRCRAPPSFAGVNPLSPREPQSTRQRLATKLLDSPRLEIAVRRALLPVEDLRPTRRRRPHPAPRPDPARARPRRRPRRVQRPRHGLPGPAVRARRADGPRSRPGVGCHAGGLLQRLPQPERLSRRQRQVVAEPTSTRRWTRSGRASGGRSSHTPSSRTRAGSRRLRSPPTPSRPPSRPSGTAPSVPPWRRSPTTSARPSCCSMSRATTTPRSPR